MVAIEKNIKKELKIRFVQYPQSHLLLKKSSLQSFVCTVTRRLLALNKQKVIPPNRENLMVIQRPIQNYLG